MFQNGLQNGTGLLAACIGFFLRRKRVITVVRAGYRASELCESLLTRYIVISRNHGSKHAPNRRTCLEKRAAASQPAGDPFQPSSPSIVCFSEEADSVWRSRIPGSGGLHG